MTAVPPQLQGSQSAPGQLEFLWEKNRRTIYAVLAAAVLAIGLNEGLKKYNQYQVDTEWTAFAAAAKLQSAYDNSLSGKKLGQEEFQKAAMGMAGELSSQLGKMDAKGWEAAIQKASQLQKPFLIWLQANQAKESKDWDAALKALDRLESEFKEHSLCRTTDYPIQFRREEKKEEKPDQKKPEEPKLLPAVKGSCVSLLREQIARLRTFKEPPQLQMVAIPADAPKYRVKVKNQGEFVIALLKDKAPKHFEVFEKLATEPAGSFWKDMRIDEIHRPASKYNPYSAGAAMEFHFGYEGSKSPDRTGWVDKEPSKHQVDFEDNDLSHFPGAVAASASGDKSDVDRLWISATNNVSLDGSRVIIGYVVEGLDVLKKICESSLSSEQEEQMGRGKPQDDLVIESVTKV